jgi:hypothetical protein
VVRHKIDGGADYLFMDEINAALQADEGSTITPPPTSGRSCSTATGKQGVGGRTTPGWRDHIQVDFADTGMTPDRSMATFHYRAYLKTRGFFEKTARCRPTRCAPSGSSFYRRAMTEHGKTSLTPYAPMRRRKTGACSSAATV